MRCSAARMALVGSYNNILLALAFASRKASLIPASHMLRPFQLEVHIVD